MPTLFYKKFKKLEFQFNGKKIKSFEFDKLMELENELHIKDDKLIVEITGN